MKLIVCMVFAVVSMSSFASQIKVMEYPWDGQYKTVTLISMDISSPTQEREKVRVKWVYLDKENKTYHYEAASGAILQIPQDSVQSVTGKQESKMPVLQVQSMTLNCKNGVCVYGTVDRNVSTSNSK